MTNTAAPADAVRVEHLPLVYRRLAARLRSQDVELARVYDEVATDIDAALRVESATCEQYLTIDQVAERLQLSAYTVREKARAGLVAGAAKSGGVWRFRATDLKLLSSSAADARAVRTRRDAVAHFDALLADRKVRGPVDAAYDEHARRSRRG
jgi:excisionase family DNA binding protein